MLLGAGTGGSGDISHLEKGGGVRDDNRRGCSQF